MCANKLSSARRQYSLSHRLQPRWAVCPAAVGFGATDPGGERHHASVRRYEPGNPDADKSGYVEYPAINPVSEMVDLMGPCELIS